MRWFLRSDMFFSQMFQQLRRHVGGATGRHTSKRLGTPCSSEDGNEQKCSQNLAVDCILNQGLPYAVTDEPGCPHQRILTEQLKSIVAKLAFGKSLESLFRAYGGSRLAPVIVLNSLKRL